MYNSLKDVPPKYQSDSIVPNYLTIDPITGLVGANFTGRVRASGGVDIDPELNGAGLPRAENSVRWINPANGNIVASIYGIEYSAPNTPANELRMFTNGAGRDTNTVLDTGDAAGTYATLYTFIRGGNAAGKKSGVAMQIGEGALQANKVLLRADGSGDFVQSKGNALLTWPGGSIFSNALTLAHGLGHTPTTVLFGTRSPGPGAFMVFQFQAPDGTNVYLQGVTIGGAPGVGVQGTFDWGVS